MKQGMTGMSWSALLAAFVALLVAAGGYHAGKDMAGRDNAQQRAT